MAFRLVPMNLRAGDEPIRVFGELVTANFFEFLGVHRNSAGPFAPTRKACPIAMPSP